MASSAPRGLRSDHVVTVGIALFSMLFGAGNLIIPPLLALQAGTATPLAMIGFLIAAIGLPVMGFIAVALAGTARELAGRVHPKFGEFFVAAVYLAIGPCLAIPRTSSTAFEMLVPLLGGGRGLQLGYSVVFFAAAFLVALRPEKLADRLGHVLCPALIALILILFAGCLLHPVAAQYGTPAAAYTQLPALEGILGGYQTMDTLAGLNFGAVIALNIQALGITEPKAVRQGTIRAGILAGGLLLVIYAMLAHVGALTGAAYPDCATGAETLTALASALFGRAGQVLLAAIFLLACFNTCVGLISCVGQYFHTLLPRIPYPAIAGFFAAASMLISNIGLAGIIRLSTPVLHGLYPVAIVLIVLSFLPAQFQKRPAYVGCVALTAVQSVLAALPLTTVFANALPLGQFGFGWVVPALVGLGIGVFCP